MKIKNIALYIFFAVCILLLYFSGTVFFVEQDTTVDDTTVEKVKEMKEDNILTKYS